MTSTCWSPATGDAARIAGVIDFGDAIYTSRVSEVAIAAAYSMQRKDAPVDALTAVAVDTTTSCRWPAAEIATLYPLAVTRLALNATVWTARRHGDTADYGRARSQHTWNTLQRLSGQAAESVAARLRADTAATGDDMTESAAPPTMVNGFDNSRLDQLPEELRAAVARRNRVLGPVYRLFYADPVEIVRGAGTYLYDSAATNTSTPTTTCRAWATPIRGSPRRWRGRPRRSTPTPATCNRRYSTTPRICCRRSRRR